VALTTKAVRSVVGVNNQIGFTRNVTVARSQNSVEKLASRNTYNILSDLPEISNWQNVGIVQRVLLPEMHMISNPVIKFEKNFYEKSLKKALKRRKSLYTFLEMEDLVLHEYVIKNGGY